MRQRCASSDFLQGLDCADAHIRTLVAQRFDQRSDGLLVSDLSQRPGGVVIYLIIKLLPEDFGSLELLNQTGYRLLCLGFSQRGRAQSENGKNKESNEESTSLDETDRTRR